MNSYKILNNQVFSQGKYSLVPIRMEDRYDIMEWRNEQIYHLRQSEPLTKEMQDKYFENVISNLFLQDKPSQILFSYLENNVCIGYGGLVHINWIDKNAEISFIMKTSLEKEEFHKHWSIYLNLLAQVAFEELPLHKIYTYAFDLRPHLYEALEANGFIKEAVLKEHCYFNKTYRNVIIHSRINSYISIREVTDRDKEFIFKCASDPETRKNSFNSNSISKIEHNNWFSKLLLDDDRKLFICEVNKQAAGIIKFNIAQEESVIGVIVAPEFRGKGLAHLLIRKCCQKYKENVSNDKIGIKAYIKQQNIFSLRAFKKAGFIEDGVIQKNDEKVYIYILK